MRIAITDANIFIDLIHIELHGFLFALDFEVHTSLEVFDELSEWQKKSLQKFVKQKELTLHDCTDVSPVEFVREIKALSDSDKTVLYLAAHLDAFVLTGDGLIRKIGGIQKVEIHGVFWLLDKFLENKLISMKQAGQQLKKLMDYNKRLPLNECEKRLTIWK
jgi:predicted nucleic acid-binding protein